MKCCGPCAFNSRRGFMAPNCFGDHNARKRKGKMKVLVQFEIKPENRAIASC